MESESNSASYSLHGVEAYPKSTHCSLLIHPRIGIPFAKADAHPIASPWFPLYVHLYAKQETRKCENDDRPTECSNEPPTCP